jgi:hypothetical protein
MGQWLLDVTQMSRAFRTSTTSKGEMVGHYIETYAPVMAAMLAFIWCVFVYLLNRPSRARAREHGRDPVDLNSLPLVLAVRRRIDARTDFFLGGGQVSTHIFRWRRWFWHYQSWHTDVVETSQRCVLQHAI